MLEALNSALAMNLAIKEFALMPGPAASECVAGVVQAEMARVPTNAYVVPHVFGSASADKIGKDVFRAGAQSGIVAFSSHLEGRQPSEADSGDVYVTESGGGRSTHVIHVVGMGAGRPELAMYSLEYVVSAGLQAAARRQFMRIVYSPFLIGETGDFSAEQVARIMFKVIYHHWIMDEELMPKHVLVAVEKEGTYLEFKSVLENEAPFVEKKKAEGKVHEQPQPQNPKAKTGSVRKIIYDLSPMALTAFYFAVRRSKGTMRERCQELNFFDRVKGLFTEKGGDEIHPSVMKEIEDRFRELE